MSSISHVDDPRIVEIEQLAAEEGLPLALSPQTICALEDCGWLADPFTAQIWADPARPQRSVWIDAFCGAVHLDEPLEIP